MAAWLVLALASAAGADAYALTPASALQAQGPEQMAAAIGAMRGKPGSLEAQLLGCTALALAIDSSDVGSQDQARDAGAIDAMVDAMESADAKRAITNTYRLVVSVEVLGDDSKDALTTLLSHMPETIASGSVISYKPKGTGKKLTYMDHDDIVQIMTESNHEKLNFVVHATAASPSRSRECCWLVLQDDGDLITCSREGEVLSSTCDHYGLLRPPETSKARRSKELGVQGSYIASEFLNDAKAAARESIRVDDQNIKQRKKPLGLPARSGCHSCIKISRLCM